MKSIITKQKLEKYLNLTSKALEIEKNSKEVI